MGLAESWDRRGYRQMSNPALRLVAQSDSDKQRALEAALAQIDRAFGKGSVMKLGDKGKVVEIETVSTGSLGLDLALGVGGLPKGRIVEIYGPESSGKTTLALHVVAEVQKAGGTAGLLHLGHHVQGEGGLARAFGPVDLDDAALWQAADAERQVEAERAGGHRLDLHHLALVAQLHHRALAEGPVDLRQRRLQRPLLVRIALRHEPQRRIAHLPIAPSIP